MTWSYSRSIRKLCLIWTQPLWVPIHAYEISLQSGQESFTHCLHKPLEAAKLSYNSTSSGGLTPQPSCVIALPVISTKNCWANFRDVFRLWLSLPERSCWGHCREIIPLSFKFDYRQVQKRSGKKKCCWQLSGTVSTLLLCSGSPWMGVPGGRRMLQVPKVLLPQDCLGCDNLWLLLQGLCGHEPFAFIATWPQ